MTDTHATHARAIGPSDPLFPREVRALADEEGIKDIDARRLSLAPLFASKSAGTRYLLPDVRTAQVMARKHGCRWRRVTVATGDLANPRRGEWATLEEAPPATAVRRWIGDGPEQRRALRLTVDGRAIPAVGGKAEPWHADDHVKALRLLDGSASMLLWAGTSVPAKPVGRLRRDTSWPADDARPDSLQPRVLDAKVHPPEDDVDEAQLAELRHLRDRIGEKKYLLAVLKELGDDSRVADRLAVARRVAEASAGRAASGYMVAIGYGVALQEQMTRLDITRHDLPRP